MVARNWVGADGASWSTTTSWSPSGTPTTSDDCTVPSSFNGRILFTTTSSVRHFTNNSGNLHLDVNTRSWTVAGNFTNNGYVYQTATTGSTSFSSTTQAANFTPGNSWFARITIAKSSQSFNLLGALDCTNTSGTTINLTFTSGTFNQNGHTVYVRGMSNSSTTARSWNMGGGDLEVTGDGTMTLYSQSTSTCTFTGTRGWINIQNTGTGTIGGGASEASAPNMRINWLNSNSVNGHFYKFDLAGVNTSSSAVQVWNDFTEGAHASSTNMNLYLNRSSNGTYSYFCYNQFNSVRFGGGGVGCTWNVDISRTDDLDVAATGSGYTINLNDVEWCTNTSSGNIGITASSSTINFYGVTQNAQGGTGTVISLGGTNNTYNIHYSPTNVTGSLGHTNGTLTLHSDLPIRTYSTSGTVTKRVNFQNNWIIITNRDNTYTGTVSLSDGSYWTSDMDTTYDGGIKVNSTGSISLGTLMAATNAPRVRIIRSGISISGKVRELIVEDGCGFNTGTNSAVLAIGDFWAEGSLSNLAYLTIGMGHQTSFDFHHQFDFGGQEFNEVRVDATAASSATFSFEVRTQDFGTAKSDITYNFSWVMLSSLMTLSSTASTYNLYQVEGVGTGYTGNQLSMSASNATFNIDNVYLLGSVSFTGSNSTLHLNYLDLRCRSFSSSGTTNKTLNANGLFIDCWDYNTSYTATVTLADALTANWSGGGFKLHGTGSASFSTSISEANSPDRVIVYTRPGLSGRCKILQFDGGGATGGTVYAYESIEGDTSGQSLASQAFAFIGDYKTQSWSLTNNGGQATWTGDLLVQSTNSVVNINGAGFNCDDLNMTGSGTQVNLNQASTATVASTVGGLVLTSGYLNLNANFTCGAINSSNTNGRGIYFNNYNITTIRNTSSSSARVFIADATNFTTTTTGGGIIHQGYGVFNHGGTSTGSINFTTGDNTMNVTITQNMATTAPSLVLPAVRNFKNHEDAPWSNFGRWTNTTASIVYCFGNWDLYAPWYDDGTYRSKVELLSPRFSGTDPNRVHIFGSTAVLGGGYPGQLPTFGAGTMISAGTLRLVNNAVFGSVFRHASGTIEFLGCNLNCTALWWEEGGGTYSSGTRTWSFPSANKYVVPSINWPHPNLSFLTCTGDYYNNDNVDTCSGVYFDATYSAIQSQTPSSTPPNYIFASATPQISSSPFYANHIKVNYNNVPASTALYTRGIFAPVGNGSWNSGVEAFMYGTNDGYIETYGNTSSPPITLVDPGEGYTKTVYTGKNLTRLSTLVGQIRTILHGIRPNATTEYNVYIVGSITISGAFIVKANQEWDFQGTGAVLTASGATSLTDNGGSFKFSGTGAGISASFGAHTINTINRSSTTTDVLTITSNGTVINTIQNNAGGGGSFAFVNGGGGAPTFGAFNIDGIVTAQTYITGPVISSGSVFTVDYATITNSAASPSAKWIAGTGSIDSGGNSGWEFAAGPPPSSNADKFFLVMA